MNSQSPLLGIFFLLSACSGSVDVDAASVLPGSWLCDDGIVVSYSENGKYEWRVPAYDDIEIYAESNDQIRMNDDGGYSIMGTWNLRSGVLELDMFGEVDRYTLRFGSETRLEMDGPDDFSCERR